MAEQQKIIKYIKTTDNQTYNIATANKLTFSGAASGTFDGSDATTITIPTIAGPKGDTGDTYVPSVDTTGNISWTKQNKPTTTPTSRNIKGPAGGQGPRGYGVGSVTFKSGSTSAGGTAVYSVKQETTGTEIGTFSVYNGTNGANDNISKLEYESLFR